jgi:hypothetical protein
LPDLRLQDAVRFVNQLRLELDQQLHVSGLQDLLPDRRRPELRRTRAAAVSDGT